MGRPMTRVDRTGALVLTGFAFLLAAGCGSTMEGYGPDTRAGLSCVDDSPHCIGERSKSLAALKADPNRAFVREPATPAAYASGVRLFALKSRKGELTCEELAIARREAEAAGTVLRGPGGQGLTTAQIARGSMLGAEVARELAAEQHRRCKV